MIPTRGLHTIIIQLAVRRSQSLDARSSGRAQVFRVADCKGNMEQVCLESDDKEHMKN
jgi:hypothetical protein